MLSTYSTEPSTTHITFFRQVANFETMLDEFYRNFNLYTPIMGRTDRYIGYYNANQGLMATKLALEGSYIFGSMPLLVSVEGADFGHLLLKGVVLDDSQEDLSRPFMFIGNPLAANGTQTNEIVWFDSNCIDYPL
jgi:hypothetical protein